MFHYLLKNIKNLITKEKFLFSIIVIVQIISAFAIMFAYGIINHYNMKNEVTQGTILEMDLNFFSSSKENGIVTAKEMLQSHNEIINLLKNKISYEYIMSSCSGFMIDSTLEYKNGKIVDGESDDNRESGLSEDGRDFTDEEKTNGAKVVIVCASNKRYKNNTLSLENEKYKVIGYAMEMLATDDSEPFLQMPIMSLPDKAKIRHLILRFASPLDENEYNTLKEVCIQLFGNRVEIPEFVAASDIEDSKTNNTIILAGVILIIFAAVNYCIMYRYILEKRKRTLAIYRICGCTKFRTAVVYMLELFGISILIFAILIPIYNYIILPQIGRIFEYMKPYYSLKVYLWMMAGYGCGIFAGYGILVATIIHKTPVMLSKEGEL